MNKFKKEILGIETHKYAPELNKVILKNGGIVQAPNHTNIDVYLKHFYKPIGFYKKVKISVTHNINSHKCCDKIYSGYVKSYATLKNDLLKIKERHNLIDAKITILNIETIFN